MRQVNMEKFREAVNQQKLGRKLAAEVIKKAMNEIVNIPKQDQFYASCVMSVNFLTWALLHVRKEKQEDLLFQIIKDCIFYADNINELDTELIGFFKEYIK